MNELLHRTVVAELLASCVLVCLFATQLPRFQPLPQHEALQGRLQAEEQQLEGTIDSLRDALVSIEPRLLRESQMPALLSALGERAAACGFELDLLTPGGLRRDPSGLAVTVDISLRQPFQTVVSYLRELQRLPYLLSVQSMTMVAPQPEPDAAGAARSADADESPVLDVTLSISACLVSG